MGYTHLTNEDITKGRVKDKDSDYFGLIFDDDFKSEKKRQIISEKFKQLEDEIALLIDKKADEFLAFIDQYNAESSMGSIGKKQ